MSVKATNWAYSVGELFDLTASERLVLLALSHRHNQATGQCNPSLDTLARMAGLTERRTRSAIASLEAKKLVRRHVRTINGRQRSNDYQLFLGEDGGVRAKPGLRADARCRPPRGDGSVRQIRGDITTREEEPVRGRKNIRLVASNEVAS